MAKTFKASSEKRGREASRVAVKVVLNAKTGELVTVKGVGALGGSGLEIEKGVNLLEPIAEQVFGRRSKKRKAG